jgi:hypothetical protein
MPDMADNAELTHQEQHRLRAALVRDGERKLAYHTITDYKNATPTFPKKRKSRAKPKVKAEAPAALEFFPEMEDAVPYHPNTRANLLARLNAGLQNN